MCARVYLQQYNDMSYVNYASSCLRTVDAEVWASGYLEYYICNVCVCSISPGCLTETFWRKPWLLHALVIRNMRQLPTKGENANISCYHHTSFSIHDLQWHSKCISGISLPTGALAQLPEPLLGHALSAGSSCPINPWIETAETVQSIEHGKGTKSPSKPIRFNMIIIWLLYSIILYIYIYVCVCVWIKEVPSNHYWKGMRHLPTHQIWQPLWASLGGSPISGFRTDQEKMHIFFALQSCRSLFTQLYVTWSGRKNCTELQKPLHSCEEQVFGYFLKLWQCFLFLDHPRHYSPKEIIDLLREQLAATKEQLFWTII